MTQKRLLPVTSSESNASTLDTTTSSTTTSSTSPLLPSKQKITTYTKQNRALKASESYSNTPMDGYTIIQNQILYSLMCQTKCQGCGDLWNGTMKITKRESLFLILCFQCVSCKQTINIGKSLSLTIELSKFYGRVYVLETSPKVVASARRDINARAQLAGHSCGIRYAGLAKLLGAMNLSSPIQNERYSK